VAEDETVGRRQFDYAAGLRPVSTLGDVDANGSKVQVSRRGPEIQVE